jgi:hypothetical protein
MGSGLLVLLGMAAGIGLWDMTCLDSGAREPVALPARLFGEQEENLLDRLRAWLGW